MGADADHDQPLVVAFLDARGSVCGSGSVATSTSTASSICFLVRLHDEDRLAAPEHLDVLSSGDRREIDSIGAPAAMVEASGFIWEISGQATAAAPTAATEPVAT
jgi:hypothetical protein